MAKQQTFAGLAWKNKGRKRGVSIPERDRPLTEHQKKVNQSRSRTRARGEHAFRMHGRSKDPLATQAHNKCRATSQLLYILTL
jgi:hypothetical protein